MESIIKKNKLFRSCIEKNKWNYKRKFYGKNVIKKKRSYKFIKNTI
jgi:hypothetical protein